MNNVMKASKLSSGSNYHVFKEGVQPMWEDSQNRKGGKWVMNVNKKDGDQLDQLWLNVVSTCTHIGMLEDGNLDWNGT